MKRMPLQKLSIIYKANGSNGHVNDVKVTVTRLHQRGLLLHVHCPYLLNMDIPLLIFMGVVLSLDEYI